MAAIAEAVAAYRATGRVATKRNRPRWLGGTP
jgi:hypothetical protein